MGQDTIADSDGHLEPAASIIKKLGGYAKVTEILGCGKTAPYSWTYPRSSGGTDGQIPQRHHRPLLDYASKNNIDLRSEHFHAISLPVIDSPPTEPERAP